MNVIIGTSIGTAALAYEIIAVFGYLTFGTHVGPNIVAMYPSTSLFIAFGQLAIVVTVLLGFPLQVHPCRNCLDKVIRTKPAVLKVAVVAHDNDGAGDEDHEDLDEDHSRAEMTPTKHAVLTAAIIAFGFMIAYFVDDLTLGTSQLVGAVLSSLIMYYYKYFPLLAQRDQRPSASSFVSSQRSTVLLQHIYLSCNCSWFILLASFP
jgi:amino acid permease